MGVVQEDVGDGEGVRELPVADEGHGADDADALLPERLAVACQLVQEAAVLVQEPFPEEGVAAQVHQVPVVDAVGVGEVEVDARLAEWPMPKDLDQCQQRRQPQFVILAGDALLQFGESRLPPAFLDHCPRHGYLDSQELVPLAVLPRPGLEKPRQAGHMPRVGLLQHACQQDVHRPQPSRPAAPGRGRAGRGNWCRGRGS